MGERLHGAAAGEDSLSLRAAAHGFIPEMKTGARPNLHPADVTEIGFINTQMNKPSHKPQQKQISGCDFQNKTLLESGMLDSDV